MRSYASFGPHIGTYAIGGSNEIPPHRWVFNGWEPILPTAYSAVTFADDAGKVLSIRDSAAKSIIGTEAAKAYKCHSCGSFQSENTEAFDSPITSTAALGVDLSKIGIDTLPFTFDSASYPIDAGYKLYGSSDWGNIGAASFHGTTAKSGHAGDFVLHTFTGVTFASGAKMYVGLYNVVANRSEIPINKPSTYPALDNTLLHSANTLISAGFASPASSRPEANGLVFSGIVRYGTQSIPNSQTTDVAFSLLRSPPYLNAFTTAPDHVQGTLAAGYRSVDSLYNPIDGSFDIHSGERGFFGRGDLLVPAGAQSLDFALSGYRFFDAVEARDVALNASIKYKMSSATSGTITYQSGALAVLTAGRANNMIVTDAHGGANMLPNNARAAEIDTAPDKALSLSLGYDWHQQQTCSPKIRLGPPCFASAKNSTTYGLHWSPFLYSDALGALNDAFVEYSRSGSETNLFPGTLDTRALAALGSGLSTTANRTIDLASFGLHIFKHYNGCSTLLFTQANRGGDIDNYGKSAPQPGSTRTASLELAPGDPWPSLVVAYSRVRNDASTNPLQTLFLVRVQFGLPPNVYADAVGTGCSGS